MRNELSSFNIMYEYILLLQTLEGNEGGGRSLVHQAIHIFCC